MSDGLCLAEVWYQPEPPSVLWLKPDPVTSPFLLKIPLTAPWRETWWHKMKIYVTRPSRKELGLRWVCSAVNSWSWGLTGHRPCPRAQRRGDWALKPTQLQVPRAGEGPSWAAS